MYFIAKEVKVLQSKHILIFGGDNILVNSLKDVLLENGSKVTIINSIDYIESQTNSEISVYLNANIQNSDDYENYFDYLNDKLTSFDGVVFALSEGSLRPLSLTKPSITHKLMEVNCLCFIELIRVLDRKKKITVGASIVAISSISSLLGLKTKLAYGVSKAALNSSVLHLASELSNKKIRVNAILKGAMTNDLNHDHVKNMFAIGNDSSGSQELGLTEPNELSSLIAFLLSDNVKTMTGTLLKLDGGYSLG